MPHLVLGMAGLVLALALGQFAPTSAAAAGYEDQVVRAYVVLDKDSRPSISSDPHQPGRIAWGRFVDSSHTRSNFGHLQINTSASAPNELQMYAAGMLEGWLTAERIYAHFTNMWAFYNVTSPCPVNWLLQQDAWVAEQLKLHGRSRGGGSSNGHNSGQQEPEAAAAAGAAGGTGSNAEGHREGAEEQVFWSGMSLVMAQLQGLTDGYNARVAAVADAAAETPGNVGGSSSAMQQKQRRRGLQMTGASESSSGDSRSNSRPSVLSMHSYSRGYGSSSATGSSAGGSAKQAQGEGQEQGQQQHQQQRMTHTSLPPLQRWQFLFLSSIGDFGDIVTACGRREGVSSGDSVPWSSLSPHDLEVELGVSGKCSALIKILPDFSNVFFSQAAWFSYAAMNRIFKQVSLSLQGPKGAMAMAYSSYPGELSSDDDFYLLSSGLVVLQTTHRIFNMSLYDTLTPRSVHSWQRVRTAHLMAPDGASWAGLVKRYNSGTYNNQWMLFSMKAFVPLQPLPPGTLWVVEQMPGLVLASDLSQVLAAGYWASYNVPYHREIYDGLGWPAFLQSQAARGPAFEAAVSGLMHQLAPRAKIFRRDHGAVTDLGSFKRLMRSNNWPADPYAANLSLNQVCGRGDVDPTSPKLYGCYDSKVADLPLALSLEAEVVNGPPHTEAMPPFEWAGAWASALSHEGQPTRFVFEFERMPWEQQ